MFAQKNVNELPNPKKKKEIVLNYNYSVFVLLWDNYSNYWATCTNWLLPKLQTDSKNRFNSLVLLLQGLCHLLSISTAIGPVHNFVGPVHNFTNLTICRIVDAWRVLEKEVIAQFFGSCYRTHAKLQKHGVCRLQSFPLHQPGYGKRWIYCSLAHMLQVLAMSDHAWLGVPCNNALF